MSQKEKEKLTHAFISNRVDYCNVLLTGLARIPFRTKTTEHITTVPKSLHWHPVSFKIYFKVLLLVYKSLNGLSPEYISGMLWWFCEEEMTISGRDLMNVGRLK